MLPSEKGTDGLFQRARLDDEPVLSRLALVADTSTASGIEAFLAIPVLSVDSSEAVDALSCAVSTG